ncbi:MAG TPA: MarR family transcriptional regulator, partial [Oscillatoriaceae cyanobacterium]
MKNGPSVDEAQSIDPAIQQACESIGSLMELWGFKRIHGMLWTYIFLQPGPVTANQIREALGVSSGLVSMTLADLERWDVVHRRSPRGDRRDYFTAEAE